MKKSGWRMSRRTYSDPAVQWTRLPSRIAACVGRLRGVNIECRPALDMIRRYADPDMLLYCDPPYPLETRHGVIYAHEMSDDDHAEMLAALVDHPGPVMVSGYRCHLYDETLGNWARYDASVRDQTGVLRSESLWLNPVAVRRNERAQPSLFALEVSL
jgi:DNA adenine methylase